MVDAMVWILRTGSPWRDLPWYFGPWKSVYTRFRRWNQQGVWASVLETLAKQQDAETFIVDATIVRAHQDATGAKKKSRKLSDGHEEAQPRRFTFSWTLSDSPFESH